MKWADFGLSKQVNERGTCSMSQLAGTRIGWHQNYSKRGSGISIGKIGRTSPIIHELLYFFETSLIVHFRKYKPIQ
jgi:hypothetical protein